jgi:acyl carrier protein
MPEITHNEVDQIVVQEVCAALAIDKEEAGPNADLFADLGAESVYMLEIRFRVERAIRSRVMNYELKVEQVYQHVTPAAKPGEGPRMTIGHLQEVVWSGVEKLLRQPQ